MLFHEVRHDLRGESLVKDPLGLNQHHRADRAKSVAAGLDDFYLFQQALPLQLLLEGIPER